MNATVLIAETNNTFDLLPIEILYHIFDYLPVSTCHYTLRLVCRRFCSVLSLEKYFKCRLLNKHLKSAYRYPFLEWHGLESDDRSWYSQDGRGVSWQDMAVRLDSREHLWGKRPDNHIDHRIFSVPHNACVDAVRLIQNGRFCVSGGRDKSLCLWNTENIPQHDPVRPESVIAEAHDAWIWSIADDKDTFYTSGWDHNVKQWTVRSEKIELIQIFRLSNSSMCLAAKHGMLVCGNNSGQLVLIDPRISISPQTHTIPLHRGVITGLNIWNNYILSVGEDRKMGVTDFRMNQNILHQNVRVGSKICPKSSGVHRSLWYIGDIRGTVHIFDMQSNFKPVMRLKANTERSINALVPSLEGIIVGTSDTGLEMIVPTEPKQTINDFNCSGEVTSIDYKKNTLIAGCSNSHKCVHIYKPTNSFNFFE